MAAVRPLIASLQSSSLRKLSGSVSPASPLSPCRTHLHAPPSPSPRSAAFSPALNSPPKPMPWMWSCHKCHASYPLGATRRCLHDGHYFCGGITVNKFTGKTKKHRACASEFDYISWEKYGKWRNHAAKIQHPPHRPQHCEQDCDFPSECHWKTPKTPKKSVNFGFLDVDRIGTESATVEPSTQDSNMRTLKKTGSYIDKIVKAAEKRTSQLTTLLSTIEEERNLTSAEGYVPTPKSSPPKLPEMPSLSGLGLSFPVMDFSNFMKYLDGDASESVEEAESPASSTTTLSTIPSTTSSSNPDSPMTDWMPSPVSPPISLMSPNPNPLPLDFKHSSDASPIDDDEIVVSPLSPRRKAWEWTAGDIGVALTTSDKVEWNHGKMERQ